jgi:hypothetical protein
MSQLKSNLEKISKFLASTAGRDKFYRIIQYLTKLISYHLAKSSPSSEFVKKLSMLSVAVGQGRKCTEN